MKAEVFAYQGKYQEAASIFIKAGKTEEAIKLFTELKRFDDAQRYLRMGTATVETKNIMNGLVSEQASWAEANGEWKQAGQLYITAKDYRKAI